MSHLDDRAKQTATLHAAEKRTLELISKDGEVLGTFCISHMQTRIPNDEDLESIEAAGHIARIAIERQRSQESLTNALALLQKSEAKLRQVIDTIPTLAWCNLPDGPNEFLNRRWHEYTGRLKSRMVGAGRPSSIPMTCRP